MAPLSVDHVSSSRCLSYLPRAREAAVSRWAFHGVAVTAWNFLGGARSCSCHPLTTTDWTPPLPQVPGFAKGCNRTSPVLPINASTLMRVVPPERRGPWDSSLGASSPGSSGLWRTPDCPLRPAQPLFALSVYELPSQLPNRTETLFFEALVLKRLRS